MAGRSLQDLFRQVDALEADLNEHKVDLRTFRESLELRIETLEKGRIPHRDPPKVPPFPDVLRDIGLTPRGKAAYGSQRKVSPSDLKGMIG